MSAQSSRGLILLHVNLERDMDRQKQRYVSRERQRQKEMGVSSWRLRFWIQMSLEPKTNKNWWEKRVFHVRSISPPIPKRFFYVLTSCLTSVTWLCGAILIFQTALSWPQVIAHVVPFSGNTLDNPFPGANSCYLLRFHSVLSLPGYMSSCLDYSYLRAGMEWTLLTLCPQ